MGEDARRRQRLALDGRQTARGIRGQSRRVFGLPLARTVDGCICRVGNPESSGSMTRLRGDVYHRSAEVKRFESLGYSSL